MADAGTSSLLTFTVSPDATDEETRALLLSIGQPDILTAPVVRQALVETAKRLVPDGAGGVKEELTK